MLRLTIKENGHERTEMLTDDVVRVGRSDENTIEIDDLNSSRFHCEIRETDGQYEVVDLGSRNGTTVNGNIVSRSPLQAGDRIEIGKVVLLIEPDGAVRAPVPEKEILSRFAEIFHSINTDISLRALLERIMDAAVWMTSAERGFLILSEGGRMRIKASRNIDRETIKRADFKISRSIAQVVVNTGEPLVCSDAQEDTRFRGESVYGLKLRSVLCVPFRVRGRLRGVLYVDHRFERGMFTEEEMKRLQGLSDLAAIAIEQARLLDESGRHKGDLSSAREAFQQLKGKIQEERGRDEEEIALHRDQILEETPLRYRYDEIVTRSPKMRQVLALVDRVTDSRVSVLVQGESGTGKELIARAIHFNSPRKSKPFVSENCAAAPSELMESEFFGYVRGAFTGAVKDTRGLFEVADGGTLFLDEIGEMSRELQGKLLRVLQDGEVRRIGSKETIRVDVRIISATNCDLQAATDAGEFREDLYYRLKVIQVDLPPLRERKEDVPLLVEHFLERAWKRTGGDRRTIDDRAISILRAHHWRGNVRELENELERALALSGDVITPAHLSPSLTTAQDDLPIMRGGRSLKELVGEATESVERRAILEVMESTDWKKARTAEILGVSRPTLDTKIEKYGLAEEIARSKRDAAASKAQGGSV
ncbi:MAG: sigma 54-interacting transcriptional regulator [Planctomycetota bacterium]|nr:sigma 54-interacting transcriptional regulator [Planctomycetota bacterium]